MKHEAVWLIQFRLKKYNMKQYQLDFVTMRVGFIFQIIKVFILLKKECITNLCKKSSKQTQTVGKRVNVKVMFLINILHSDSQGPDTRGKEWRSSFSSIPM